LTHSGNTFPKSRRLSSRAEIASLLKGGRYGVKGVLRYCWVRRGDDGPARLLVSVPKKYFKRAVARNLLKRRIRESFRLQFGSLPPGVDVMLVYPGREIRPFDEIYRSAGECFEAISKAQGEDNHE